MGNAHHVIVFEMTFIVPKALHMVSLFNVIWNVEGC